MSSLARNRRCFRDAGHPCGNTAIVVVVILVVLVAGFYFGIKMVGKMLLSSNDNVVQWQFTSVERKPFQHTVIEQGNIESSSNVEVNCKVRSRNSSGVQILWVIEEGERVIDPSSATVSGIVTAVSERVGNECTITVETTDGTAVDHPVIFSTTTKVLVEVGEEISSGALLAADKLVELDSSALEDEENRQQIAVNQANSSLISAKATVEKAEIARLEYLEGIFRQDVQLMSSEILVQEENVNRAKDNFKFSTRLAAQGFLTEQQLKADEFAVQKSEIDLNLAMGRLKTLEEITKQKMLVGFDSDIETAKSSLNTAEKNLVEEESDLQLIRQQIVNCLVYAPAGGQVVHANKQSSRGSSEFIVEPGAMVRERQTIIHLPDTEKMQVKAKVNEGSIPFVRAGQAVKIKVGALEGLELDGIVEKVNPYAEPTSYFSSGVKEYATYIRILDPPTTIRTGMSAEVTIFVKSRNNALQVPVQVLHEESSELYCLVRSKKSGELFEDDRGRKFLVEIRELEFDASNETSIVVTSGLKEKEKVVRNPRLHEDILNRLIYNHRAQWLLDQLDSNGDKLLTREELEANRFESIVALIIDAVMVTDTSDGDGDGDLFLDDEDLGDGQLDRDELAVFAEDGKLYVAFKKEYLLSSGADKLVAIQDGDKNDSLDRKEFERLAASIKESSGGDKSLKKMTDELGQYNINESMLQTLGEASFADLDENSNQSVGWYEVKRYLQMANFKKASKPEGGDPGSTAGGRPGGGRSGGAGGGDPAQVVERMMGTLDKDKDGNISAEEAAASPYSIARFDTDGDGQITSKEIADAIQNRAGRSGGRTGDGRQPRGGGGQ